jgi:hypothetical protein
MLSVLLLWGVQGSPCTSSKAMVTQSEGEQRARTLVLMLTNHTPAALLASPKWRQHHLNTI